MTNIENNSSNAEKMWSIGAKYDVVYRSAVIEEELEGENSQRVQEIDYYVDFINNVMSSDYRVMTYMDGMTYRLNERGEMIEYRKIVRSDFIGDKVFFLDGMTYVLNSKFGIAAIAHDSIQPINVVDFDVSPYNNSEIAPGRSKLKSFENGVEYAAQRSAIYESAGDDDDDDQTGFYYAQLYAPEQPY